MTKRPVKGRTWADKGSRHERGYGSSWDRIRLQALKRDHYLCQPCQTKGRVTPAKEVDHIVPKSKGGTDELSNLQSICTPCHRDKTLSEAAEAQGKAYHPRPETGLDGWPVR